MKLDKTNANFLNRLGASVFAYSNGKVDMHYTPTLAEGLKMNERGADLYFIANPSTGMKEKSVKSLTCNFIDLDAGRPNETSYHSTSVVNAFKKKVMSAVASSEFAGLKPTYIVETRNGYHLYWVYEQSVEATMRNIHDWKLIEKYLIAKFAHLGADPHVNKPNQLLRVPGTYWHKKWSGNKKFPSHMTYILPTKKKRELYNYSELLSLANRGIDEVTKESAPIIAVARSRSSYQPHQDVNATKFQPLNMADESQYSYSQPPAVAPVPHCEQAVSRGALTDIVAYLRAQNMNYLASQLDSYLRSH